VRAHTWDAEAYLSFEDERARPFHDLMTRVTVSSPRRVVDLGCGAGNLTEKLAQRWPSASVLGVDNSAEMIEAASRSASSRVSFQLADLRDWRPDRPVDVLLSNATLQWVPNHIALLARLIEGVRSGGQIAIQVPGNFDEPSHRLLHELAAEPPFAECTRGVARPSAYGPEVYLAEFARLGCSVEAWETTYFHVLSGTDPVFRWISGTGARPILAALPAGLRTEFEREYAAVLRQAYPERQIGTVLPFRRVFAVATKSDEAQSAGDHLPGYRRFYTLDGAGNRVEILTELTTG
jgi:trans-aconitate 2-methyltransferase